MNFGRGTSKFFKNLFNNKKNKSNRAFKSNYSTQAGKVKSKKRFLWLLFPFGLGSLAILYATDYRAIYERKWKKFIGHEKIDKEKKKNLVILGSGWSAISLLQELDDEFNVSIVSPRNYFLFTPLLPGVAVGTNEERSITEPVRKFCFRGKDEVFKFYEAKCIDIDPVNNKITCIDKSPVVGHVNRFELPYDILVIGIGAKTNTFNTPGATEYAHFLKKVEHARKIRSYIMDSIETANLPGQPLEEVKRLLNFVIVGGGPTGVEFAAELNDFLHQDLKHFFPSIAKYFSVTLIQSADHILNTFDEKISEYTKNKFQRENITVLCDNRVTEVTPTEIIAYDKKLKEKRVIPYGVCVWSTGLKQRSLVDTLKSKIPEQQHKFAILTDPYLKVKGTNNIYAIGDCSEMELPSLHANLRELFEMSDVNGDGVLSRTEFNNLIKTIAHKYPQLQFYSRKVSSLFDEHDENNDGYLSLDEFEKGLIKADSMLKTLPSTAQVASQQGSYLGKALCLLERGIEPQPFTYYHRGFFAKVGSTDAVADLPILKRTLHGIFPWYMWGAVYLSKQYSFKNKVYVGFDWFKTKVFGRDLSRF